MKKKYESESEAEGGDEEEAEQYLGPPDEDDEEAKRECPRGPSFLLYLAIARGHLPSWNKLAVMNSKQCLSAVAALQAGHLTSVKELEIRR